MTDLLQSIILGAVQGLSEFLPISSSGHLILAHWLFGKDLGLSFDVALHWGTLFAVLFYFRMDVINLIRGFWHSLFKSTRDLKENIYPVTKSNEYQDMAGLNELVQKSNGVSNKKFGDGVYQKLSWLIIIASIPAAIIGRLLETRAETIFRNPVLVALNLAIFGLVILFADKVGKKEKNLDKIKWTDALIIGLLQALAIIPGISRSGATIAAGLFLAFKRPDAARFSFLMSIPIIFGAGLVKLPDLASGLSNSELVGGFISAAVFGFLAIKYLLRYISKNDFKVFVWYRLALAALILLLYFGKM